MLKPKTNFSAKTDWRDMSKITGLVICKNEENNIEDCIKSLIWCDEIILIDSFSEDNTLKIAKNYAVNIYQNEWKGFSEQRKFALTKVKTEWIISLDADERCSEALKNEIQNIVSASKISESGFLIPRENYFLGKWIKHCGWYPDHQMRLFKSKEAFVSNRIIHESYEVNGSSSKLQSNIIHFTAKSVSEYTEKINHYSGLSALEKVNNKSMSYLYLLLKPKLEFLKKFIFQLGFLDGKEGLMVSNFHMMTKSLTYMKIYEMQKSKKNK